MSFTILVICDKIAMLLEKQKKELQLNTKFKTLPCFLGSN